MKPSTILILLFSAIFLFTGCVEVTFPEPMPYLRRDRTVFPISWQGEWHYKGSNTNMDESITIHPQYVSMENEQIILNEKTVLRKFNGYFIISMQDDDDERWSLIIGKRRGSVLSIYEFEGTDENYAIWKEVLGVESIEEVTKSDDDPEIEEYQINPENNAAFRKLLNSDGLTHMGDYVR